MSLSHPSKTTKERLHEANSTNFVPTPKQIEKGLRDIDVWVKCAWIRRTDFTPTPKQIERGLTASVSSVRWEWAKRPNTLFSLEQIHRGVFDEDGRVREKWAELLCSCEFIDLYLNSYSWWNEQINRLLVDEVVDVRIVLAEMIRTPTLEHIEIGLTDEYWYVRKEYARKPFTATEMQIERGLTDKDEDVRVVWAKRTEFTPTPKQIERGLADEYKVRRAWISRLISDSASQMASQVNADEMYTSI